MAETQTEGVLKGMESNVKAIGTIFAFVIGLPSLVYTWNNQANERAKSFAAAVDQEETRWSKLYEQYYTALADEAADKKKLAAARLEAVCRLAAKPVTDFAAFPLGTVFPSSGSELHMAEKKRLESVREGLMVMLQDPDRSSVQTVTCIRKQLENLAAEDSTSRVRETPAAQGSSGTSAPPAVIEAAVQQTEAEVSQAQARNRTTTPPVSPAPTPTRIPTPSGPSLRPQALPALSPETQSASVTLSAGIKNGWDIDVFWCEGQRAAENLVIANASARRLLNAKLGTDPIGRVRLRMLTLERQADPGYRPIGLEVRGENIELQAAESLSKLLSTSASPFVYRPSRQVTAWYLSAFVCQP